VTMTATERPASEGRLVAADRLVAVDLLRGLAALAVVFTHLPRPTPTGFDLTLLAALPFDFGTLGVPMFIVISGFCIHLGYARRLATGRLAGWSWAAFWKRRFVRLYPTYLVAIAFSLAVVHVVTRLGHPVDAPANTAWDLLTHVFMVHNLTVEYTGGLGNPPFWTLGLEEQLYGLFAVVVLLRARMSATKIVLVGTCVSVVWRLAIVWVPFLLSRLSGGPNEPLALHLGTVSVGHWDGWPFGWWFLWLLGAMAAEAYLGLVRLPDWCSSWGLILGSWAVTALTYWRTLGRYTKYWMTDEGTQGWVRAVLNTAVQMSEPVFAVGCFALLLRLIRAERAGRLAAWPVRLLATVGLFSYSLYLTHLPVIELLTATLGAPTTRPGLVGWAAVAVPVSVAWAGLFFLVFERPFLHRARPAPPGGSP
jgi:peptidoglycan/LPS O-acetylase OafA/YrhL